MKNEKILLIDLDEAQAAIEAVEQTGGNYEGKEPPARETQDEIGTVYYVVDMTADRVIGPYDYYEQAKEVADERKAQYPDHIIIIQSKSSEAAMDEDDLGAEVAVKYYVTHLEKNRRYGPYFSFGAAQKAMIRMKKKYPGDTFDIEKVEFEPGLQAAETDSEVTVLQHVGGLIKLKTQGRGTFKAGRFNTADGDSGGFYRVGTTIGLSASPAEGSKFSHWNFNGNFGSDSPRASVKTSIGLVITAVFVLA